MEEKDEVTSRVEMVYDGHVTERNVMSREGRDHQLVMHSITRGKKNEIVIAESDTESSGDEDAASLSKKSLEIFLMS